MKSCPTNLITDDRSLTADDQQLLTVIRQQLERLDDKPAAFDVTVHASLTHGTAKTIVRVSIAVIINAGAIDVICDAIDAHGQVAASAGQAKLTLAARSLDDSAVQYGAALL